MGDNNKIKQESLQPKRLDPKQDKAYQSVLDIAERLQAGDATNIALTGPYGSGKSSILISLKDDYPQYEYLNIYSSFYRISNFFNRFMHKWITNVLEKSISS